MTMSVYPAAVSFVNRLLTFDHGLFDKINSTWHNDVFDTIMPLLREAMFWLPLYVFLLLFVTTNFKKQGFYWALMLVVTAATSNYISSNILKAFITRVRPCHNPMLVEHIRILVKYCPQSSSFTSSHATNHFAASMFIWMTLKQLDKNWMFIFAWAVIICYAQVYVGVHYPADVAGGAIVGMIVGYVTATIFNRKSGLVTVGRQHII
jgi:membrane-associated phospholipid phosphatase